MHNDVRFGIDKLHQRRHKCSSDHALGGYPDKEEFQTTGAEPFNKL